MVTVAAEDYRLSIRHAMDTGSNTKRMGILLSLAPNVHVWRVYSKEEQIKVTAAAIIVDV